MTSFYIPPYMRRWRPGGFARGTIILFLFFCLRTLCQSITFLLIAYLLDPTDYGKFVSVFVIMYVLSPLVGLGHPSLMVREINRDKTISTEPLYQSIFTITISSIPIFLFATCVALLFFYQSIDLATILFLSISELLLVPYISTIYKFFQAKENPYKYGVIILALSSSRLLGVLVLYFLPNPTVFEWSLLHFTATFLVFCYCLNAASKFISLNPKTILEHSSFSNLFIASSFALSESSRMIHSDSDKTLLAKLSNFNIAGQYSLAYRLIDLVSLPIYTVIETATPRIYKTSGKTTANSPEKTTLTLFAIPLIYSILLPFGIYFLADLIPLFLGEKYNLSKSIIIYISFLPLLFLLRTILRLLLVTLSDIHTQAKVEMFGGLVNVLFSIIFIILFDWRGAIFATVVAELIMITMFFKQYLILSHDGKSSIFSEVEK